MTRRRPTKLTWTGDTLPDGRPAAHLGDYGIPPVTIEGDALDALSVQQIAIARDSGLYRVTEAPEPKAAKPAKADKASKAATGKTKVRDDAPNPSYVPGVTETPDEAPNGAPVTDTPVEPDTKGE